MARLQIRHIGGEGDAGYQGISSGLCSSCCVWNSWIVCWDGLSALVRVNVIKVVMIVLAVFVFWNRRRYGRDARVHSNILRTMERRSAV